MTFKSTSLFNIELHETFIPKLNSQYWISQLNDIIELDPKGVEKSNGKGYQSSTLVDNPNFFPLINNLSNLLKTYFPKEVIIDTMWGNISPPGSFNWPHAHSIFGTEVYAGVLYLQVPKNSGEIMFQHPLAKNSSLYKVMPVNNQLIIFPGYLTHSVDVNKSNDVRISIAFNFECKDR